MTFLEIALSRYDEQQINIHMKCARELLCLQEDLKKNRISLEWRDFCSGLLIPLNKCRQENFYMPWTCKHEKHEYEKCQYFQYKSRLLKPEGH